MKGWECPKCGKVNAPWKDHCDCVCVVPSISPRCPFVTAPWPNYPQPYIGDWPPFLDYMRVTCNNGTKI